MCRKCQMHFPFVTACRGAPQRPSMRMRTGMHNFLEKVYERVVPRWSDAIAGLPLWADRFASGCVTTVGTAERRRAAGLADTRRASDAEALTRRHGQPAVADGRSGERLCKGRHNVPAQPKTRERAAGGGAPRRAERRRARAGQPLPAHAPRRRALTREGLGAQARAADRDALDDLERLLELVFDYVSPVEVELRPSDAERSPRVWRRSCAAQGVVRGARDGRCPAVHVDGRPARPEAQLPAPRRSLRARVRRARHAWRSRSRTTRPANGSSSRCARDRRADRHADRRRPAWRAAVAGRLIELQGGELRRATAAPARRLRASSCRRRGERMTPFEPRVLVVDDDPLIREELESLLRRASRTTSSASPASPMRCSSSASASSRWRSSTCGSAAATASRSRARSASAGRTST